MTKDWIQQHSGRIAITVVLLVLLIDQMLKVWVKTNMYLGEQIEILSWFKIRFLENNGMAYGMEIFNKLFLTLFRLVAVGLLFYYLRRVVQKQFQIGYIICISLIIAGALGNIIDSLLYGHLFSASGLYPGQVATFMPPGGGYEDLFYGKVVDMFYFPIIDTTLPEWIPVWGGKPYIFFSPIFNVADSAITCGVVALLIFFRHNLSEKRADHSQPASN